MKKNELSTEIITHKLKLKGEGMKYISKKLAENIFGQLADPNNKTITIVNPQNLTYISKYRSEVELSPLDLENRNFEDKIHMVGLNNEQKERFRNIWNQRKKENKTLGEISFQEIAQAIKSNKL